MSGEMASTVTGLLSEARTKIAEGEWIRGRSRAQAVRTRGGETLFDYQGIVAGGQFVWCYCVMGALDAAHTDLVSAAARSGLDEAKALPYWQARELAIRALVAAENRRRTWRSRHPSPRLVQQINDSQISNKDQALAWFDRAIEEAVKLCG